MFLVNFYAMAQTSDFGIERRQVVFPCWMQDSKLGSHIHTNLPADWIPTHKATELSRIKLKTWIQQPVPVMSEHSAHLTSLTIGFCTWLWRYTCLLLISMLWHRQSKGDRLSSSWMQDSKLGSLTHQFASRLNAHSQSDWAIEDQAKNLNSTARPYDEWAFEAGKSHTPIRQATV